MSLVKAKPLQRALNNLPAKPESDPERLARLRNLAKTDSKRAKTETWQWFKELQLPDNHFKLSWLFSQGIAPESPDGDCEGIVMNLHGNLWLSTLDKLVRLGQALGGIGWAGKSFNAANGTGYNRLTSSSRIPAFLTMPTYSFQRINGELIGFHYFHELEPSPIAPHAMVRAIKYDAPAHDNPLVLPRTRDELVEIIPDVYLGRALLREAYDWRVVGYFGLRYPVGG